MNALLVNLNVALVIVQLLLVSFWITMIYTSYRAWKEMRRRQRIADFIMHLEYFSLLDWRVIVPKGDFPTPESEAKRFHEWRLN